MFNGTYQRIAIKVLVLTLVIYALIKLVTHFSGEQPFYLLHRQFYHNEKLKQVFLAGVLKQSNENKINLPAGEVKQGTTLEPNSSTRKVNMNQQQPTTLHAVTHLVETDQQLLSLANDNKNFFKRINDLSPSQVEDLTTQMLGVNNLTTFEAQLNFLKCSGRFILRQLHGSQPNSPISMPQSHQHCKKMSFKNSGPIVVLASVPGSGNSWVRQLLEAATGIYTGAVYCDPAYFKAGMIGELIDTNNVLVVKNHHLPYSVKKLLNNDRAIYIVRSPFGAILSEHNRNIASKYRQLGNVHALEVDFNYVNNSQWEKKVKQRAHYWMINVREWINYKAFPVHIVGYENLMKNTYTELKRMLDFIGYPYSEEDVLCAVKSSSETFHRNHTRKAVHPYSPEMQELVLNEIKQLDVTLLKHNISLYHPYQEGGTF